MVLESTIICVDNSEYMRNGDFLPTRLQAQQDAVNLVTQSKLRANPESNVGLMTLAELSVLVTLTTDTGKVLGKLHAVQPKGQLRLAQGIKIAHLTLKHRQGKNHKTRIVAFVGSPVTGDEAVLIKLAKKLKKEKVSVDIVSFGEDADNADILKKFVETVNGKDGTGSHLVTIPPGPHLSDALISSPILKGEDGSGPNVVPSDGGGFEFGVDPNEDPELALALRVSMEEQRARQEAESRNQGGEAMEAEAVVAPADPTAASDPNSEEALLRRALAMSMEPEGTQGGDGAPAQSASDEPNLAAMTEDEQIAYAMRMSMQEEAGPSPSASAGAAKGEAMEVDESKEDYSQEMNDPDFLKNVLENLPGVDPNSDAVKQAMGAMTGNKEGTKKDDDDKKKEEDKK
ncbi:hypothetical protein TCAL_07431 [Tigriopus californicus]|uniref:26S proteasome non-ATPase regulatory subunit 4 n=1 Tax=Tigriopus californicus TaxID=6832 RepID=A0A553PGB8_TIGCA|nr:26S proteasome non-ATPase regulatory subunit 4-like [Tigriopus californicus]TRY76726.1 hypothetical protein TCAL_07431 [Tigriopus californicus]